MKKNFLVTLMLVGGLFMSSCTEDIYNPDKVKEDYEQNFVDLFGEINPNQDWNVAELKSVTVEPGSSTEVQIYAKNGDVYKLVGDYKEVSGTRTLTFDAAKGVDDFYVVAGGQGKLAKNGESVSFAEAGTRSYEKDRDGVFTKKDGYVTFPWNDVMAYATRLPNDPEDGDNLGVEDIYTNFDMVMGNDKITVYPVYWNASFKHTLGIYWYEGKEKKMQDIYTDKEGNDVQVYVKRTEDTRWRPDTYEGWENVTWNTFEEPDDVTTGWWQNRKTFKGEIDTSKGIKSRGFTIDLPYSTKYGFYIKVDDGDSWYKKTYYTDASENGRDGVMAAYFKQEMDNGMTRTFV